MNVLVMSIKPQYAEAIYSGAKQFEYRIRPPQNWGTIRGCGPVQEGA